MAAPIWGLFFAFGILGILGLVTGYKKPAMLVIPVLSIAALAVTVTLGIRSVGYAAIVHSQLSPREQLIVRSWDYIASFFWSFVGSSTLCVIGLFLRALRNQRMGRKATT